MENIVTPYPDGTYQISYTPFEEGFYFFYFKSEFFNYFISGRHIIDIRYDGLPVPGSPFVVNVENEGSKKCKVHGSGLKSGIVDKKNTITLTQGGKFGFFK